MKLHLPSNLRKALLACLSALAARFLSVTVSSGSALIAAATLTFSLPSQQALAAEADNGIQIPGECILLSEQSDHNDDNELIALLANDVPAGELYWTGHIYRDGVLSEERMTAFDWYANDTDNIGEWAVGSSNADTRYNYVQGRNVRLFSTTPTDVTLHGDVIAGAVSVSSYAQYTFNAAPEGGTLTLTDALKIYGDDVLTFNADIVLQKGFTIDNNFSQETGRIVINSTATISKTASGNGTLEIGSTGKVYLNPTSSGGAKLIMRDGAELILTGTYSSTAFINSDEDKGAATIYYAAPGTSYSAGTLTIHEGYTLNLKWIDGLNGTDGKFGMASLSSIYGTINVEKGIASSGASHLYIYGTGTANLGGGCTVKWLTTYTGAQLFIGDGETFTINQQMDGAGGLISGGTLVFNGSFASTYGGNIQSALTQTGTELTLTGNFGTENKANDISIKKSRIIFSGESADINAGLVNIGESSNGTMDVNNGGKKNFEKISINTAGSKLIVDNAQGWNVSNGTVGSGHVQLNGLGEVTSELLNQIFRSVNFDGTLDILSKTITTTEPDGTTGSTTTNTTLTVNDTTGFSHIGNINIAAGNTLNLLASSTSGALNTLMLNGTLNMGAVELSLGTLSSENGGMMDITISGKESGTKFYLKNGLNFTSGKQITIDLTVDDLHNIIRRDDVQWQLFNMTAGEWNDAWNTNLALTGPSEYYSYDVGFANGAIKLIIKEGDLYWTGHTYTDGQLSTTTTETLDWDAEDHSSTRKWKVTDAGDRVQYVAERNVHFASDKENTTVNLHGAVVAGDAHVERGNYQFLATKESDSLAVKNLEIKDGLTADFSADTTVSGDLQGSGTLKASGKVKLTATGEHTFQGSVDLAGGELSLRDQSAWKVGALKITAPNSLLKLADAVLSANRLSLNGNTLKLKSNGSLIINGLDGTEGNGAISYNDAQTDTATLIIDNEADATSAADISVALTKRGNGKQTLSGSYTGNRLISVKSGILALTNKNVHLDTTANLDGGKSLSGGELVLGSTEDGSSVTLDGDLSKTTGKVTLQAKTNNISGTLDASETFSWSNQLNVGELKGASNITATGNKLMLTGKEGGSGSLYTGKLTLDTLAVNDNKSAATHSLQEVEVNLLTMTQGKLALGGGKVTKLAGTGGELTINGELTVDALDANTSLTSLTINNKLTATNILDTQTLTLNRLTVGESNSAIAFRIGANNGSQAGLQISGLSLNNINFNGNLTLELSGEDIDNLRALGTTGYRLFTGWDDTWAALAQNIVLGGNMSSATNEHEKLAFNEKTGAIYLAAIAATLIWDDSVTDRQHAVWKHGQDDNNSGWDSAHPGQAIFNDNDRAIFRRPDETVSVEIQEQINTGNIEIESGSFIFSAADNAALHIVKSDMDESKDDQKGNLEIHDGAAATFNMDLSIAGKMEIKGTGSLSIGTDKNVTVDNVQGAGSISGGRLKITGSGTNSAAAFNGVALEYGKAGETSQNTGILTGSFTGGSVTVNSGALTLAFSGSNRLYTIDSIVMNGGTLTLAGGESGLGNEVHHTLSSLTLNGGILETAYGNLTLASGLNAQNGILQKAVADTASRTLAINLNGNATFSGSINRLGVEVTGQGTQTFSGALALDSLSIGNKSITKTAEKAITIVTINSTGNKTLGNVTIAGDGKLVIETDEGWTGTSAVSGSGWLEYKGLQLTGLKLISDDDGSSVIENVQLTGTTLSIDWAMPEATLNNITNLWVDAQSQVDVKNNAQALADGSNGKTLHLTGNGANNTAALLTHDGNIIGRAITLGADTGISVDSGTATFSGVFTLGGATLTKIGDGVMLLSDGATPRFFDTAAGDSGTFYVAAGALSLGYTANLDALSNHIVQLASGASLNLAGTGSYGIDALTGQGSVTATSAGTLSIHTTTTAAKSTASIGKGVSLDLVGNGKQTISGSFAGADVKVSGAGELELGSVSATGTLNVENIAGSLHLTSATNSAAGLSGNGTLNLNGDDATLTLTHENSANTIGTLVFSKTLTLDIASVLTATTAMSLDAKNLIVKGNTLSVDGGITLDGGTLTLNGVGRLHNTSLLVGTPESGKVIFDTITGETHSFSDIIGVTAVGSYKGVIELQGKTMTNYTLDVAMTDRAAAFSSITVKENTRLQLTSLNGTAEYAGNIELDGGSLTLGGNTLSGTLTFTQDATVTTTGNSVITQAVSGNQKLTKDGSATLTLAGEFSALSDIEIQAGKLEVAKSNQTTTYGSMSVTGGELLVRNTLTLDTLKASSGSLTVANKLTVRSFATAGTAKNATLANLNLNGDLTTEITGKNEYLSVTDLVLGEDASLAFRIGEKNGAQQGLQIGISGEIRRAVGNNDGKLTLKLTYDDMTALHELGADGYKLFDGWDEAWAKLITIDKTNIEFTGERIRWTLKFNEETGAIYIKDDNPATLVWTGTVSTDVWREGKVADFNESAGWEYKLDFAEDDIAIFDNKVANKEGEITITIHTKDGEINAEAMEIASGFYHYKADDDTSLSITKDLLVNENTGARFDVNTTVGGVFTNKADVEIGDGYTLTASDATGNGSISGSGTLKLNNGDKGGSYAGDISSSLSFEGSGVFALSGSFTGAKLNIDGSGTLSLTSDSIDLSRTDITISNGGTLSVGGSATASAQLKGFTLNSGNKLIINTDNAVINNAMTVNNGATFTWVGALTMDALKGTISSLGTQENTLTLTGASENTNFSGQLNLNSLTVSGGADNKLANLALANTGTLTMNSDQTAKLTVGSFSGQAGLSIAAKNELVFTGTVTLGSTTSGLSVNGKLTLNGSNNTLNGTLSGGGILAVNNGALNLKTEGAIDTLEIGKSLILKGNKLVIGNGLDLGAGGIARSLTLGKNGIIDGLGEDSAITLNGGTLTITEVNQVGGTTIYVREGQAAGRSVDELSDEEINNGSAPFGRVVIDFSDYKGDMPTSIGAILGQDHLLNDKEAYEKYAYTGAVELKGRTNFQLAGTDTTSFALIILNPSGGLCMQNGALVKDLLIDGRSDHGATVRVESGEAEISNLLGHGYFTKDGDGTLRIKDGMDSFDGGIRIENGTLALEYTDVDGKLSVTDEDVKKWGKIYITSTGTLRLGDEGTEVKDIEVNKNVTLEGGNLRLSGTDTNIVDGDLNMSQRREEDKDIGDVEYATSRLILSEEAASYTITGTLQNTARTWGDLGGLADAQVEINVSGTGEAYDENGLRKLTVGAMAGDFRLMEYHANAEATAFTEARLALELTRIDAPTTKAIAAYAATGAEETETAPLTYTGDLTGVGSISMLGNYTQVFTSDYKGDIIVNSVDKEGVNLGGTLVMDGKVELKESNKLTVTAGTLTLHGEVNAKSGATVGRDGVLEVTTLPDAGSAPSAAIAGTLALDGTLAFDRALSLGALGSEGETGMVSGTSLLTITGSGNEAEYKGAFATDDEGAGVANIAMKADAAFTQKISKNLALDSLQMESGTLELTEGGAVATLDGQGGSIITGGTFETANIADNARLDMLALKDDATLRANLNSLGIKSLQYGVNTSIEVLIRQDPAPDIPHSGLQLDVASVNSIDDTAKDAKVNLSFDKYTINNLRNLGTKGWQLFDSTDWNDAWSDIFELLDANGVIETDMEQLSWVKDATGKTTGAVYLKPLVQLWYWLGNSDNVWNGSEHSNWDVKENTADTLRDTGRHMPRHFSANYVGKVYNVQAKDGDVYLAGDIQTGSVTIHDGKFTFLAKDGCAGLNIVDEGMALTIGNGENDAVLTLALANANIPIINIENYGTLILLDGNAISEENSTVNFNGGTLAWGEDAEGNLAYKGNLKNATLEAGATLNVRIGELAATAAEVPADAEMITLGGAKSTPGQPQDDGTQDALAGALTNGVVKDGRHGFIIEWSEDSERSASGSINLLNGKLKYLIHGTNPDTAAVRIEGKEINIAAGSTLELEIDGSGSLELHTGFTNTAGIAGTESRVTIGGTKSSPDAKYELHADNSAFEGVLRLQGSSRAGDALLVGEMGVLGGAGTTLELAGRHVILSEHAAPNIDVKKVDVIADTTTYIGGTEADAANARMSLKAGALTGSGVLANAWGSKDASFTHTLESVQLTDFNGWIVAGDERTKSAGTTETASASSWTLAGALANNVTELNMNLAGSGTISLGFTNVNANGLRLRGVLGHATYGSATGLENATDGLVILTNSTNSAQGALIFNSNVIQLGEQSAAGSWGGSRLVNRSGSGEGVFRLVNGALNAALAPVHDHVRVEVDARGTVDVGGTQGSALNDISIHGAEENGSGRLTGVAGDIIAGGERGIRVRLEFGKLDNAPGSQESDYLISSKGGDLVINRFGEGGLELDFTTEAFVQLLLDHRETDYKTYLHILAGGGALKLADGMTWDSLSVDYTSPAQSGHYWELLRDIGFNIVNGMGGTHRAESASSGDLVIAGTSKDIYLVLNPYTYKGQLDDPDAATRAHHVSEYGKLSAFKATVVDANTTLTVEAGELPTTATDAAVQKDIDHGGLTINNLVGLKGSELKLKSAGGKWFVLNNERISGELDKPGTDHLDESAAIGQDTSFKGLITGEAGVSIAKTGAGKLSVGDSTTQSGGLQLAGDLSLREGGLSIQGGSGANKSFVRDIDFAYTAKSTDSAFSGLEVTGGAMLEVRGILHDASTRESRILLTEQAQLILAGGASELSHTRISSDDQTGRLELCSGSSLTLSGSGLGAEDTGALHNVALHLAEGSALTLADAAVASGSADMTLEGRLLLSSGAGIGDSRKAFGGNIDIRKSGELSVDEGSAIVSTGNATVSGKLDLGSGSANSLAHLNGSGVLAGGKGSSLSLTGSGANLFTGSLTGARAGGEQIGGSIHLAQNADLTLRNVTTDASRWSITTSAGSSLEVDVQTAPESASLNITLAKGSGFVYRFAHETDTRLHGELKAEGDVSLTLHSDGAQATGDVYLGDIYYRNGNLDYLRSQLTLTGTALAGYEGELVTLEDEKLALVLRKATHNQYEMPAMEKNPQAGANLLWDAITPGSAGRDYIDSHPEGDLHNIFRIINNKKDNREDISHATAALAGSSVSVLGLALNHDIERHLLSVRNRANSMRDADVNADPHGPAYNMWINAESAYYKVDKQSYAPGYTLNGWGGTVGINWQSCVHTDMGIALSAMYNDLKTDGADHGRGDMDATYLSAYMRTHSGRWTHTLVAAGGLVDVNLKRSITATQSLLGGQLVDTHTAHTSGQTDGYALGVKYEVNYSCFLNEAASFILRPTASVSLRRAQISGYTESGSDAGLRVRGITHDIMTLGIGARVQKTLGENAFNRTSVLTAHALLTADLGDRRGIAATSLIHGNGRLEEVESAKIGTVGIEFGAGLTVPLGSRSGALFLDASAELRSNYFNANASAGYRFDF